MLPSAALANPAAGYTAQKKAGRATNRLLLPAAVIMSTVSRHTDELVSSNAGD